MNIRLLQTWLAVLVLVPVAASASGLSPWKFGMTPTEVRSFKEFGPYKTFSNGDLETFNGRFHGRKENVQFFFENGRLTRIGIYLWEGKDPKKGIPIWQRAYGLLEKSYGKVATPDMRVAADSSPVPVEVMAFGAAAHADITGRTRMHPRKQPKDVQVSAQFLAYRSREGKAYAIAIYLDPKA